MLAPFKRHDISLSRIESRPSQTSAWDYVFFIDFEGHRDDGTVGEVLAELNEVASGVKNLGSYPRAWTSEFRGWNGSNLSPDCTRGHDRRGRSCPVPQPQIRAARYGRPRVLANAIGSSLRRNRPLKAPTNVNARVAGLSPYQPGKPVEELMRERGSPTR